MDHVQKIVGAMFLFRFNKTKVWYQAVGWIPAEEDKKPCPQIRPGMENACQSEYRLTTGFIPHYWSCGLLNIQSTLNSRFLKYEF